MSATTEQATEAPPTCPTHGHELHVERFKHEIHYLCEAGCELQRCDNCRELGDDVRDELCLPCRRVHVWTQEERAYERKQEDANS